MNCEHNWKPVGDDNQCFQCGNFAVRPCKNKVCLSMKEQNEKMKQALMRLAEDRFATTYTKSIISAALLTS